jgi:hypothetical protein
MDLDSDSKLDTPRTPLHLPHPQPRLCIWREDHSPLTLTFTPSLPPSAWNQALLSWPPFPRSVIWHWGGSESGEPWNPTVWSADWLLPRSSAQWEENESEEERRERKEEEGAEQSPFFDFVWGSSVIPPLHPTQHSPHSHPLAQEQSHDEEVGKSSLSSPVHSGTRPQYIQSLEEHGRKLGRGSRWRGRRNETGKVKGGVLSRGRASEETSLQANLSSGENPPPYSLTLARELINRRSQPAPGTQDQGLVKNLYTYRKTLLLFYTARNRNEKYEAIIMPKPKPAGRSLDGKWK